MQVTKTLKSNRAEAYIGTGVKIIIAVVVGALILGSVYLVFAGRNGIMSTIKNEIQGMMGYTQELRVERTVNETTGRYYLRYSYDGKRWEEAKVPTYSANANVYSLMSNNDENNPITVAVVRDNNLCHILTTPDGGITWNEVKSFTAYSITHCYFGTSARLPNNSTRFSGEKFAIRFKNGSYYVFASDGTSWNHSPWVEWIK